MYYTLYIVIIQVESSQLLLWKLSLYTLQHLKPLQIWAQSMCS